MTVAENDLIVGPITPANGVTLISLDFDATGWLEEWVKVYKGASDTPLVLGSDYTVAGEGTASGSITLTTPADGATLYAIYLEVPLERLSDFQVRGEFRSEPLNDEFDRLWQRVQLHDTLIDRSLAVSKTSTAPGPIPADATRASKILAFDAAGAIYMLDAAYPLSGSFATRAEFVANKPTLANGAVVAAGGLFYEASTGATGISDLSGFVPFGDVTPDHWAENTTPGTTDMGAAMQSAIDYARIELGGGEVQFFPKTYGTGQTVKLWERVFLRGSGGIPVNWYSAADYEAKGSAIIALPGLDADAVQAVISGNTVGSPVPAETNADRRHGGGITNLLIDGNKSANPNPGNTDRNSAGNALALIGVNVIHLRDIVLMRAAENGLIAKSNGQPDGQCNNLYISHIYSGNNEQNNFDLAGGDSNIAFLWGTNAGGNGLTSAMAATEFVAISMQDSANHGIYSAGEDCVWNGARTYHNRKRGIYIDAPHNKLIGCRARHNGMNTGASATERAGIYLSSNADHYTVLGCSSYDDGLGDPLVYTQQYGFYLNNTGLTGVFEGNYADNNQTSDYFIASNLDIDLHQGVSASASHPGFTATGSIDMDGNLLSGLNGLSFDAPRTVTSVTSNVLSIGADSLVTMNVSGGATVNSISSSASHDNMIVMVRNIEANAVTFTNGANLRMQSGANLSLAQYAAATFAEFADGVWYQVG